MHPQYIRDFEGRYETGFGNTDYRTLFPVVYEVSWHRLGSEWNYCRGCRGETRAQARARMGG